MICRAAGLQMQGGFSKCLHVMPVKVTLLLMLCDYIGAIWCMENPVSSLVHDLSELSCVRSYELSTTQHT